MHLRRYNLSTPSPLDPILIGVKTDDGTVTHETMLIDPRAITIVEPSGEGSVLRFQQSPIAISVPHPPHLVEEWVIFHCQPICQKPNSRTDRDGNL